MNNRPYAPMRALFAQPRHPALPPTWRCLICHGTGVGGPAALDAHAATHRP